MNGKQTTYLKKISFRVIFLMLAVIGLAEIRPVYAAQSCGGSDCSKIDWKSCPPGARQDISVACIKKMNADASSCIDTMPVASIDRISEDMCLRNRKSPKHEGMDYASAKGTNVTAAADGVVVETNNCSKGYGRKIVIEHQRQDGKGSNFVSVYAHLSEIGVSHGQRVTKGQVIGKVGGTSCSGLKNGIPYQEYGNHLHFELRNSKGGTVMNPMCDNVQSLCGTCVKDFKPNKCRVDCQKNPNDLACKKTSANGTSSFVPPYNHSTPDDFKPAWSVSASQPTPVVPINPSISAKGKAECNVETYRNTFSKCVFCDLFRIMFDTASIIAKKAYMALAEAMVSLVAVGMALWLAMTVLKFISAFDTKEPRTLIKTIFNQAFVVIIVVIILRSDIQQFIDLLLTPVFNTGMALAQMVTSGQSGQTCSGFTTVIADGGIPAAIGNNILCTIQTIQGKILDIMTLGSTSICIGFLVESYDGYWIFPDVAYVLVGVILWLAAFLLMVIYPFLLIDSILQLSIASAMLPVAVAAYAFPITRKKYVNKVWETFMTAMFTFLFLSIVIFIITTGIQDIVGDIMTGRLKNAGTQSGYDIIIDAVDGLAWWGIKFLQLVFMMLLGWAVLDQAKAFAGSFAKGGFSVKDIGSPVGGMAMNVGTQAALGVGGKSFETIGALAKPVKNKVMEKAHSARVGLMANRALRSDNATTDADGNTTATLRNWYGRKVTRTVAKDASGNMSVSNQRNRIKALGRFSHDKTTKTDQYMTIKSTFGNDGKMIRQDVKMKAAICKQMLNKDGSVNIVAVNAMRQNSTHNQDDINMAILNKIMSERMPTSEIANMNSSFSNRQVTKSEDGNAFEVLQKNADGTTSHFRMEMSGDRIMTSVETVGGNGKAVKYSSDGIIHKRSSYNYKDGKVVADSVKNKYAFADYYTKYDSTPLDANGRFSNSIPQDKIMFGQDDLDLMTDQVAHYGQPKGISEFSA